MKINCHKCNKELNLMVDSFCCGRVHLYVYPDRGRVITNSEIADEKRKKERAAARRRRKNDRPSKQTLDAVKERDGHKCVKCSVTANLEVHHKHHRKDGGSHEMENLVTLCDLCHAEEHRGETVYTVMIKRAFGIA